MICDVYMYDLQDYTNSDNPFGDQHLLDKFVWHKVCVHLHVCNGIHIHDCTCTCMCIIGAHHCIDNFNIIIMRSCNVHVHVCLFAMLFIFLIFGGSVVHLCIMLVTILGN